MNNCYIYTGGPTGVTIETKVLRCSIFPAPCMVNGIQDNLILQSGHISRMLLLSEAQLSSATNVILASCQFRIDKLNKRRMQ